MSFFKKSVFLPFIALLVLTTIPTKAQGNDNGELFSNEKATVTFTVVNNWDADSNTGYQKGYQVSVKITNKSTQSLADWKLSWKEQDSITQCWATKQTLNSDGSLSFSSLDYNKSIPAGGSIEFGYIAYSKNAAPSHRDAISFVFSDSPSPSNTPPANTYPGNTPPVIPSSSGPFSTTPVATPARRPRTGEEIVFRVQGNRIVDDQGNDILFKGLDRPSLEWNPQGTHLSEEEIATMKEKWKANVVRISLNQNYWFCSQEVNSKGSYKQIINAIVASCIKNDMAVILDLHWTENGHQNPMANRESLRFWREVATAYKDFGTVIFEPFNEPYDIPQEVWLHGDAQYAGYQELVDEIRKTGAKNLCIMNGLDWAYDLSFVNDQFNVKGENLIYGSHPYNEKLYKSKNHHQSPLLDEANFQGVLGRYPLIFTEFGVDHDSYFSDGDYKKIYQDILNFCNDHHISYTAWAWWNEPGKPAFPCLIGDWGGTPLNGGILVKQDMTDFPGTPIL
jgi:hypothetical protein